MERQLEELEELKKRMSAKERDFGMFAWLWVVQDAHEHGRNFEVTSIVAGS